MSEQTPPRRDQALALTTAFLSLFSIVGVALYGLPFFYDFFVTDLGWSRQQVTSGNALSKLLVGPLFGFLAGVIVDRFGPRRLMLAGIGMLIGAPAAIAIGKLVESALYGVPAINPGVSVAAALTLLAASVFAAFLPARRAMRISPAKALRHE